MSKNWFKKAVVVDEDEGSEEEEEFNQSEEELEEEEDEIAPKATKKGSYFKRAISESEEEEGEEDEEDEEEEQVEEEEDIETKQKSAKEKELEVKRSKWVKKDNAESDSDTESDSDLDKSDDEKTIVLSAKEKRLNELNDLLFKLETKISANHWKDIEDDLKVLQKSIERIEKLRIPEYTDSAYIPKSCIRFIADLEDAADKAFKNRTKISTEHSKALGSLRGKLKKLNAPFKKQIAEYKREPSAYVDREEEEEEEVEEEEEQQYEPDEIQRAKPEGAEAQATVVKRGKQVERAESKIRKVLQKKKPVSAKVAKEGPVTEENLEERLDEIRSERGYRGTNPVEQLQKLAEYLEIIKSPQKILLILELVISTLFDINPTHSEFMPVDNWRSAISNFAHVLYILNSDKELKLPNLVPLYDRLDDGFIKSLQYIDSYTQDYMNRLKDEMLTIDIGERVFELCSNEQEKSLVAIRLAEHIYYRKQDDHERLFKKQREVVPQLLSEMSKTWLPKDQATEVTFNAPSVISEDVQVSLIKLCNVVFIDIAKHSDPLQQSKSVKCVIYLIYNLALHGEWERARDLLLKSRLGDIINQSNDVSIMAGYNRAICQLGICAFRKGLISDSHYLLNEICSTGKAKEQLLAQSILSVRHAEKSRKGEEKLDRNRLVPYHKHINLDMLDAVYLINAMLLEIPNMAQRSFTKRKSISKTFRRLLDFYDDRQVFCGPPETTRDYINAASKALMHGDWQQCYNFLMALDMWTLMINAENVKKMLFEKIKVEAMRTYLFTYSHHYDTIASSNLSVMFALDERFVHGIVSKMITNEELYAAWDQPTNTFKVYRSEPSKLQQLALQVSETAGAFVEWNEKMLEAKSQGGSMISMAKDSEQKKKKKTIRSVSTKQTGSKQTSERAKKPSSSTASEKPKATIKAH